MSQTLMEDVSVMEELMERSDGAAQRDVFSDTDFTIGQELSLVYMQTNSKYRFIFQVNYQKTRFNAGLFLKFINVWKV